MRPILCEEGTNVAVGTKYIAENGRMVLPWYNPAEGKAPSDWKEKWRKLRDRFEKIIDEGCKMECFLIQRRIPQSKAGHPQDPGVLQSRNLFRRCNGLWIEPSKLFAPTGEPLVGLFPFKSVRGEPMLNSQGQPVAFRLGLSHHFAICHEPGSESESEFQTKSQIIELAKDATNLVYQLPAVIACWLWRNVRFGFSKTENADDSLWFDALFQISLAQQPGSPLFATRYDWEGNGYIGLVGNGLFPRLPDFGYSTSLDDPKPPKDEDYPMAYYAKLPDLAKASVAAIDEILGRAGMTLKRGERFGDWVLMGDKAIGVGGNGTVWRCRDSRGTISAIKFFNREDIMRRFPDKPDELDKREKRFREEAAFLTREGRRSGILPLIDSNLMHSSSSTDGALWFVMPWADPFPKLSGAQNLRELVSKFQIIANTLAELHAEGKWHRDIHPGNLFIYDGKPVIGDFGLVDYPNREPITAENERIGARNYVAPELREYAEHGPADKADVYSLARCFWAIASGKEAPPDHQLRIETRELRLSTYCPHKYCDSLDLLMQKSTEYDPKLRPSMKDFAAELSDWLKLGEGVSSNVPDLSALTKECQSVFQRALAGERTRERLIRNAESVLNSFNLTLTRMSAEMQKVTTLSTRISETSSYPDIYDRYPDMAGAGSVWRGMREVRIAVKRDISEIVLRGYVHVRLLENDEVRILIGYISQPFVRGEALAIRGPWKSEIVEPSESTRLLYAAERLQAELIENLPTALHDFVAKVKQLFENR